RTAGMARVESSAELKAEVRCCLSIWAYIEYNGPMQRFEHVRHKLPTPLAQPRELIVACAPFKSNVNLSNIVRTASCCGVRKIIATGQANIDKTVARDGADEIEIAMHRTLPQVLKELKQQGYTLVGLEQ